MLRRLTALLLAFACIWATALPVHGTPDAVPRCCCGPDDASPCGRRACAPPPASSARAPLSLVAEAGPTATAVKPAARTARLAFAQLVSLFVYGKNSASLARASFAARVAPAARVALFQAHCSLLI